MTAAADLPADLPPIIRAWVVQLLDASVVAMLNAQPDAQVDIRLSASKGKVRRRPVITLNGGPSDYVAGGDYTSEHMA